MMKNDNVKDCNNCDSIILSFQDEYDKYISDVQVLLSNENMHLGEEIEGVIRSSLRLLEFCRKDLQDLETYRTKFTPVSPMELEMSDLKKCHIGRCKCGQLLIESRHICCPKCLQFIDWSCKDC